MAWSAAQGGDGGRARPGSAQGRRQHRERSISGPAAPPWVAFGHFISPFGSVIHSAQTEGKGSIRSKAPSAKQRAELATPAREHAEPTCCPAEPAGCCSGARGGFQAQGLPGLPRQEAPQATAPALQGPMLSCFPFPRARSPLQNTHARSKVPGAPAGSRGAPSRGQSRCAQLEELFYSASLRLFYPSTFKNSGAIHCSKTEVVAVSRGRRWSCPLRSPGRE